MAFAVPRGYVDLADLAAARGVPASKYTQGLGVLQMSVAHADEDPVTLATEAARRCLQAAGRSPSEIGLCIVGTETAVDHSKPIASYLHGLLGLPSACRVFETKHACFGGTAGLLNAIDWLAAGSARGRCALIVCTDIARYSVGTAGEPTQGAGAVAMLISENPRLVELEPGITGCFSQDVHDFWRPLYRKDALVDGQFSVQCYLDALTGAYAEWQRLSESDEPLVRTCYHVPYGKMARKAHQRRCQLDGMSEEAAERASPSRSSPRCGCRHRSATSTPARCIWHCCPCCITKPRSWPASGSACSAMARAVPQSFLLAAFCQRLPLRLPGPPSIRLSPTVSAWPSRSMKSCAVTMPTPTSVLPSYRHRLRVGQR
jgi:3-hydroxy-3-methylglutaryl CoA synthase